VNVEEVCDYVKSGTTDTGYGSVHLQAKTAFKAKRFRREAGQFLCGSSLSRAVKNRAPATADEFLLEECLGCGKAAEKYGIELGARSANIPGPRVTLYTTSPAKRDRFYAKREGEPVGAYRGEDVYAVSVPKELADASRVYFHKDKYFCWHEEVWTAMLTSGAAEPSE
jgi:hypothetical protein